MTSPELADLINDAKAKAWNESVSPRLESLRSWLSSDEWTKGIAPYWRSIVGFKIREIMQARTERDVDQFNKGFVEGLQEVLRLPDVIQRHIDLIAANKKKQEDAANEPSSAGY